MRVLRFGLLLGLLFGTFPLHANEVNDPYLQYSRDFATEVFAEVQQRKEALEDVFPSQIDFQSDDPRWLGLKDPSKISDLPSDAKKYMLKMKELRDLGVLARQLQDCYEDRGLREQIIAGARDYALKPITEECEEPRNELLEQIDRIQTNVDEANKRAIYSELAKEGMEQALDAWAKQRYRFNPQGLPGDRAMIMEVFCNRRACAEMVNDPYWQRRVRQAKTAAQEAGTADLGGLQRELNQRIDSLNEKAARVRPQINDGVIFDHPNWDEDSNLAYAQYADEYLELSSWAQEQGIAGNALFARMGSIPGTQRGEGLKKNKDSGVYEVPKHNRLRSTAEIRSAANGQDERLRRYANRLYSLRKNGMDADDRKTMLRHAPMLVGKALMQNPGLISEVCSDLEAIQQTDENWAHGVRVINGLDMVISGVAIAGSLGSATGPVLAKQALKRSFFGTARRAVSAGARMRVLSAGTQGVGMTAMSAAFAGLSLDAYRDAGIAANMRASSAAGGMNEQVLERAQQLEIEVASQSQNAAVMGIMLAAIPGGQLALGSVGSFRRAKQSMSSMEDLLVKNPDLLEDVSRAHTRIEAALGADEANRFLGAIARIEDPAKQLEYLRKLDAISELNPSSLRGIADDLGESIQKCTVANSDLPPKFQFFVNLLRELFMSVAHACPDADDILRRASSQADERPQPTTREYADSYNYAHPENAKEVFSDVVTREVTPLPRRHVATGEQVVVRRSQDNEEFAAFLEDGFDGSLVRARDMNGNFRTLRLDRPSNNTARLVDPDSGEVVQDFTLSWSRKIERSGGRVGLSHERRFRSVNTIRENPGRIVSLERLSLRPADVPGSVAPVFRATSPKNIVGVTLKDGSSSSWRSVDEVRVFGETGDRVQIFYTNSGGRQTSRFVYVDEIKSFQVMRSNGSVADIAEQPTARVRGQIAEEERAARRAAESQRANEEALEVERRRVQAAREQAREQEVRYQRLRDEPLPQPERPATPMVESYATRVSRSPSAFEVQHITPDRAGYILDDVIPRTPDMKYPETPEGLVRMVPDGSLQSVDLRNPPAGEMSKIRRSPFRENTFEYSLRTPGGMVEYRTFRADDVVGFRVQRSDGSLAAVSREIPSEILDEARKLERLESALTGNHDVYGRGVASVPQSDRVRRGARVAFKPEGFDDYEVSGYVIASDPNSGMVQIAVEGKPPITVPRNKMNDVRVDTSEFESHELIFSYRSPSQGTREIRGRFVRETDEKIFIETEGQIVGLPIESIDFNRTNVAR